MSCYHPLKAFILGIKENGTKNVKITSYNVDHLEKNIYTGKLYEINNNNKTFNDTVRVDDFVEVPCGHCVGCRIDYSRMWSCRLLCELQTQPAGSKSYFVTLTYDDDHVPTIDSNFPESPPLLTLRMRDLQLFMKSIRKRFTVKGDDSTKIRFFAAGEYGTNTFRQPSSLSLYNF